MGERWPRTKEGLVSSSSKLNNRQERKRGKSDVDEVNIVLPWQEGCDGRWQSWSVSSSSKPNNRQERNRGKHHVDEVNIVLLWHEALAEAVLVG